MNRFANDGQTWSLPRPGKALTVVLVGLLSIWLMFALAVNWGGGGLELFTLFCGNTELILQGEIWRLFTAPLMHLPNSIGHILLVLLGLYFLTPSLEENWGGARLVRFLALSVLFGYGLQMLVVAMLPATTAAKLASEYWFGARPAIDAVAIAFALQFRGSTVRLFMVLPISSRTLVLFVVGISVLSVIAADQPPSGLVSPFGGMLAGWLLGGGTPSPLRRAYLRFRLKDIEKQAQRERQARLKRSPFKVIQGGKDTDDSDAGKGPNGNWLN